MRPLLLGLLLLMACAEDGTELRVGVASSLAEAFSELDSNFQEAELNVSAAGSQVLVAQVREGAPLDVIVTADLATMDRLRELDLIAGPAVRFAGNTLVIAVEAGNPLGVDNLDDLAADDLTVVLAAPDVPAGAYTGELLAAADTAVRPDSLEPSVRAVLAKVALGEADAGIVYATDVRDAPVTAVTIPESINIQTSYYAAPLRDSALPGVARRFVDFLAGEQAGIVLTERGFLP